MYDLCSENKGADQLRGHREADLHLYFRICNLPVFSQRSSYKTQLTIVIYLNLLNNYKKNKSFHVVSGAAVSLGYVSHSANTGGLTLVFVRQVSMNKYNIYTIYEVSYQSVHLYV